MAAGHRMHVLAVQGPWIHAQSTICVWEMTTPETHHEFGTLARTRYATRTVVWAHACGSGCRELYPALDLFNGPLSFNSN